MFRKYLEFACITLLSLIFNFNRVYMSNLDSLEELNEYVNVNCLSENLVNNSPTVLFDYNKINFYLKDHFKNYKISKISESEFNLIIDVKENIFFKEIKENYNIKKGDNYD